MRFITNLFRDSFARDIGVLLLVSILIGSVVAGTLSLSANAYFSKALSGLVGDYGEYDIIIQVREEMKEDATLQINKIIGEVFPGARFKEGPTVTGKTNLFISLPDAFKTMKIWAKPSAASPVAPVSVS